MGLAFKGNDERHKETPNLRNIGNHQYVHNSPIDYVINSMQHLRTADLENHDDFYLFEDGNIYVQDQRGERIMYESALQNFRYVWTQIKKIVGSQLSLILGFLF